MGVFSNFFYFAYLNELMRYKLNIYFKISKWSCLSCKNFAIVKIFNVSKHKKGSIFQNSKLGSILKLNNWKTVNHTDIKFI